MTTKKIRCYAPVFLFIFLLLLFHVATISYLTIAASAFYAIIASESALWIILLTRRKARGIIHLKKKLRLIVLYGLPVLLLVSVSGFLFSRWIGLHHEFAYITGLNMLCCSLVIGAYECVYYVRQWKRLFIESENIRKSTLHIQYKFLRDQIKPHFLFNSLNSLTSLISQDPEKAERYVEEMAMVYRYLLKNNGKALTTFKEEKEFLSSYLVMLHTRFNDALIIDMQVNERYDDFLIPPFVLQLLVENAVKHNVVSLSQPLTIRFYTDEKDQLHICNNLQKKRNPPPSEKTGLRNISSRYELLPGKRAPQITEQDDLFKVMIPLIPHHTYETIEE
jgi:Putative regulator of cell autolysis